MVKFVLKCQTTSKVALGTHEKFHGKLLMEESNLEMELSRAMDGKNFIIYVTLSFLKPLISTLDKVGIPFKLLDTKLYIYNIDYSIDLQTFSTALGAAFNGFKDPYSFPKNGGGPDCICNTSRYSQF